MGGHRSVTYPPTNTLEYTTTKPHHSITSSPIPRPSPHTHTHHHKKNTGLKLRGISARPTIGYLTHLETLRYVQVGAWVVYYVCMHVCMCVRIYTHT